jgi:DNA invertase Pin-like site-specific DNA recombinase
MLPLLKQAVVIMARIFVYRRVSTDQQAESGAGLSAQMDACTGWAEAHKVKIEAVYSEEGVSGAADISKRPALMEVVSLLQKGDILLIAKRDRLGRDPIAVAMIEAMVNRKKAKVVSAAGEGTDSDGSGSVFMRRIIDAVAELERNVIGERTRAAMQAMKRKNERVGHIPFGFRLSADGEHIEMDAGERAILKQIRELMDSGLSVRKIVSEMNRRKAFNRGGRPWNHASMHTAMTKIAA